MYKLAIRNIVRQRAHTAMSLSALVFGVVGLIIAAGWVNDIFLQLGEALIHSQSGHMQVYRKGYYEGGTRSPGKYLIDDPEALQRQIASIEAVNDVMARLNFSGLLSNGRSDMPVIGEGVEADKEAELGTAVSIVEGRRLNANDAFGMLIGRGLAQALQLKPGDHATLLASTLDGALNTVDLEVVGVFESFSNEYDARAVRIALAAAQELLGTRAANALVITLRETPDTQRIASMLARDLGPRGLEVKTWVELNDFYEKTVRLYERQLGVLQAILLAMVVLTIANTVNMSVFERLGEFGTMRALGSRSRYVFGLILTENLLLGLLGSGLGVMIGILLAALISEIGIPMPPPPNANLAYIARIQVSTGTVLMAFVIGVLAPTLAALWPARRVSRTPVVDALRSNV
jgi:putative ABC transport system permease protein